MKCSKINDNASNDNNLNDSDGSISQCTFIFRRRSKALDGIAITSQIGFEYDF